jgi:dTMP kinase
MMHPYDGLLITLEGIDGSGKSTLAQKLFAHFAQLYPTTITKEPGATPLGTSLRTLLQERTTAICPRAEFLLFAADRAQHLHTVVIPALQAGKVVISDRMADSSLVYQGYARGLDRTMITSVNRWAMQECTPDVTIFVDVPTATARMRWRLRNQALSSFEQEHETFMERVRDGFHALYKDRTDVILVDGTQDINQVFSSALALLAPWIAHYARRTDSAGTTMDRQP